MGTVDSMHHSHAHLSRPHFAFWALPNTARIEVAAQRARSTGRRDGPHAAATSSAPIPRGTTPYSAVRGRGTSERCPIRPEKRDSASPVTGCSAGRGLSRGCVGCSRCRACLGWSIWRARCAYPIPTAHRPGCSAIVRGGNRPTAACHQEIWATCRNKRRAQEGCKVHQRQLAQPKQGASRRIQDGVRQQRNVAEVLALGSLGHPQGPDGACGIGRPIQ